ncbi:unnamed protein product, partial [Brassica rapa subsp. trilocularis]
MIASISDLLNDLVSLKIAQAMMGYVVETVVGFCDRGYGFVDFGEQPVVFRRRSVKAV